MRYGSLASFRGGGDSLGGPCTAELSLIVCVEPAYTDLLICVHFRNSDHRGRQYPAARSIGFYWEGQMVCVLVLFRTGHTGSEQCCIPSQSSHQHFISVSQEERSVVGSVDMSRSLVFSASHRPLVGCPIPLAPIYPNLVR